MSLSSTLITLVGRGFMIGSCLEALQRHPSFAIWLTLLVAGLIVGLWGILRDRINP